MSGAGGTHCGPAQSVVGIDGDSVVVGIDDVTVDGAVGELLFGAREGGRADDVMIGAVLVERNLTPACVAAGRWR